MSAQRTGIEADRGADGEFRRAAVVLHDTGDAAAARDAAEALVALALAEREDALRAVLTPDPVDVHVTWSVACYRIGDLAPSGLRDFSDPVSAVAVLTG